MTMWNYKHGVRKFISGNGLGVSERYPIDGGFVFGHCGHLEASYTDLSVFSTGLIVFGKTTLIRVAKRQGALGYLL